MFVAGKADFAGRPILALGRQEDPSQASICDGDGYNKANVAEIVWLPMGKENQATL